MQAKKRSQTLEHDAANDMEYHHEVSLRYEKEDFEFHHIEIQKLLHHEGGEKLKLKSCEVFEKEQHMGACKEVI